MKRRSFITTVGSIASATALAGCGGSSGGGVASTDPVDQIEVDINTTEDFDNNAEYTDLNVERKTRDGADDFTTVSYTFTPDPVDDNIECIDTKVEWTTFDTEGVVLSESRFGNGDYYEVEQSYAVEHTIEESPADIGRIEMKLHLPPRGVLC